MTDRTAREVVDASTPQIKVCGLTRRADAALAEAAGADHLGVILAPGYGRSVSAAAAAALFSETRARRIGVFVNAPLDDLIRDAEAAGLDGVQLHGDEEPAYVRALRLHGSWTVWKVIRPRGAAEFAASADRFAADADGLLLDGWSAAARGGTGTAFPWDEVAAERDRLPAGLPLAIAGGLRPDNVRRAIDLLRPDVVDVSSGVESAPGVKDADTLRAFVAAVRGSLRHP